MSYRHRFSKLLPRVRRTLRWVRSAVAPVLTCEQVVGLIADYLTGALGFKTTTAFDAHTRRCDNCLAFLNTYQHTIIMVRSLRFEDLSAELETRLRDFLKTRSRPPDDGRWPPPGPAQAPISRLLPWLRRPSTGSECGRLVLLPFVMMWTC